MANTFGDTEADREEKAALQQLRPGDRAEALDKRLQAYEPGAWFTTNSLDEMQAFYMSRLSAIREAAKECGFAIGLHGSARRDFDLMAMAWREDAVSKDELASAVSKAACGFTRESYEWTDKGAGRSAVSLPCCWVDIYDTDMKSLGHIDLSVIEAKPPQTVPDGDDVGAGWMPIETAPRDGTEILVFADGDGVGTAKFLFGTNKGWVMTYNGARSVVDYRDNYEMYTGVTHWMPLPAPPAVAITKVENE